MRADQVIVAAGAIYTPVLLWNSGVRRAVGDNFQAHPGAAVVGRFDRPIPLTIEREIPQDPGAEARFTMCDYATAADERGIAMVFTARRHFRH